MLGKAIKQNVDHYCVTQLHAMGTRMKSCLARQSKKFRFNLDTEQLNMGVQKCFAVHKHMAVRAAVAAAAHEHDSPIRRPALDRARG
eukprot:6212787-Pleurochrysis_carterae.AAC.1